MQSYLHTVGPALIFLSATDSTVAAGAGWTFIGPTDGETTVALNIEKSHGGNDVVGSVGIAGATYYVGANPEVSCMLLDETKARLTSILGALSTISGGGAAIGLNAGLTLMVEPMMCIIPIAEINVLIAASSTDWTSCESAIWLQAVDLVDFGQFTRALPAGGQKNTNPRTTTFRGLFRETTRATEDTGDGLAIDAGAQILWIGDPDEWNGTAAVWSAAVNLPAMAQFLP